MFVLWRDAGWLMILILCVDSSVICKYLAWIRDTTLIHHFAVCDIIIIAHFKESQIYKAAAVIVSVRAGR